MDQLARLGLPKETLRGLGIAPGDPVEFSLRDGAEIVVTKCGCAFCGAAGLLVYAGRPICRSCAAELAGLVDEAAAASDP